MDPRLLDILVCPVCTAKLDFDKPAQELICKPCQLAYPVRDGIPIMMQDEARSLTEQQG